MLKAPPQDFSPRPIASTATHKPVELCDPGDRLTKRRWLGRWLWDTMDGTIERLPFVRLQFSAAKRLRGISQSSGRQSWA
jgi:hypothetical protein